MSVTLLEALVGILVIAGLYFGARLAWLVFAIGRIWRRESRRLRADLQRWFAATTTEEIRKRLFSDSYFAEDIRAITEVQSFLARIAAKDEVALRQQYSESQLYSMLVGAERAAGRSGRPEAMDHIGSIFPMLDELARRAKSEVVG